MSPIGANLQTVRRRISEALQGDSREVTLVAVSKSHARGALEEALDAGCHHFGESYLQEAAPKMDALGGRLATWHFIGALQRRKAREIAGRFAWVHGIDRLEVAQALSTHRPPSSPALNACIQVNISGEATKQGVTAADVPALARAVATLPRLKLRGLMGMASFEGDEGSRRAQFRVLREAFEGLRKEGMDVDTLSMGMSGDFELAIREGATMVRIGTAIFGDRRSS